MAAPKFRYYIVNLEDGTVAATNDTTVAEATAPSEFHIVIDALEGTNIITDWDKAAQDVIRRVGIKEYAPYTEPTEERT